VCVCVCVCVVYVCVCVRPWEGMHGGWRECVCV
jgi:hypothetical protein